MKKMLFTILASLMLLSLTACGSPEPETVVLTYEANGTLIDYELEAINDIVQTITQTTTVDCSMYTEDQILIIEETAAEYATIYGEIEGVTYSTEMVGTDLVETLIIDATSSETLQTLNDEGLLPIEGSDSAISLEKTVENLEALGMTVKE